MSRPMSSFDRRRGPSEYCSRLAQQQVGGGRLEPPGCPAHVQSERESSGNGVGFVKRRGGGFGKRVLNLLIFMRKIWLKKLPSISSIPYFIPSYTYKGHEGPHGTPLRSIRGDGLRLQQGCGTHGEGCMELLHHGRLCQERTGSLPRAASCQRPH